MKDAAKIIAMAAIGAAFWLAIAMAYVVVIGVTFGAVIKVALWVIN